MKFNRNVYLAFAALCGVGVAAFTAMAGWAQLDDINLRDLTEDR